MTATPKPVVEITGTRASLLASLKWLKLLARDEAAKTAQQASQPQKAA